MVKKIKGIACPVYGVFDHDIKEELSPILTAITSNSAPESDQVFPRGLLRNDGRLDMCKQALGVSGTIAVMETVSTADHISAILLGTNGMGNDGVAAVSNAVSKRADQEPIETVYLGCNHISANGIAELARSICRSPNTKHLWLKRNPLGPQSVPYLCEMISNSNLETLDLTHTHLNDQNINSLMDSARKGTSIKHWYLGGNGLTEFCIDAIAKFLPASKTETLMLDTNAFSKQAIETLSLAISNTKSIRALSLASNGMLDKSCAQVLNATINNPNMESLDIGNSFSAKAIQAIIGPHCANENNAGPSVLDIISKGTGRLRKLKLPEIVELPIQLEDLIQKQNSQLTSLTIGRQFFRLQTPHPIPKRLIQIQSIYR